MSREGRLREGGGEEGKQWELKENEKSLISGKKQRKTRKTKAKSLSDSASKAEGDKTISGDESVAGAEKRLEAEMPMEPPRGDPAGEKVRGNLFC